MSAKPRGLGRGLDALLPKVGKDVQQVPLAQLKASPFQPRLRMDEGAIAELAASIATKGVLQPILVRPSDSGYEIVAGERRIRGQQMRGRGEMYRGRTPTKPKSGVHRVEERDAVRWLVAGGYGFNAGWASREISERCMDCAYCFWRASSNDT